MMNYPKVFIVILNYNGKEYIKKCLSSVFKINYPNFEVVVVDNDSNDESLELAKASFSKATFIKNSTNLGYAVGNNVGIRFALERMADYVLVLNNDTEVDGGFLEALLEVAERDNQIGLLSPVIFEEKTRRIWFAGGRINWMRMRTVHSQEARTQEWYESDFITGCSMLVRADVFKKIGLFDEDFFLYWEDADFSFRSKKAGFKNVVVSSSWVYHAEKSEEHKIIKTYWLVLSGLIFFKKNAKLPVKLWLFVYMNLRKIKNWLQIALYGDETAKIVKKAYLDFKKD